VQRATTLNALRGNRNVSPPMSRTAVNVQLCRMSTANRNMLAHNMLRILLARDAFRHSLLSATPVHHAARVITARDDRFFAAYTGREEQVGATPNRIRFSLPPGSTSST